MKQPNVGIIVGAVLAAIGLIQIGNGVISESSITVILGLVIVISGGIFVLLSRGIDGG